MLFIFLICFIYILISSVNIILTDKIILYLLKNTTTKDNIFFKSQLYKLLLFIINLAPLILVILRASHIQIKYLLIVFYAIWITLSFCLYFNTKFVLHILDLKYDIDKIPSYYSKDFLFAIINISNNKLILKYRFFKKRLEINLE